MLINPILIVIFSNFLLSPFEKINNKRYINKAKKKILKINPIIIGITGSFSKTTFKTYLHHFLKDKYVVYKSEGNINTLMGLTKWINNSLNSLCEILILEIGIDEYHGIRKFKKLFSLDIGVITSVGKMHLSTFKTYERIIESKCEIDYLLKDKGFLFINDYYDELKQYNYRHSTYFYSNKTIDKKLNTFQNTALNGVFQIAQFLNVEKNNFENLLKTLPNIPKRFEIKENNEMTVINDSYNINYYGVLESIKYMNKLSGVKIVITGGLIELGKHFYSENYNLGKEMKVINYLFLISNNENHPLLKGYEEVSEKKGFVVSTFDEAKQKIRDINDKKIILITAAKSDFFIE